MNHQGFEWVCPGHEYGHGFGQKVHTCSNERCEGEHRNFVTDGVPTVVRISGEEKSTASDSRGGSGAVFKFE